MGKKKIIVLTGFLGAGKTTFLKKMIKYLEDTKIAILIIIKY
jgi:G3E family GTPase